MAAKAERRKKAENAVRRMILLALLIALGGCSQSGADKFSLASAGDLDSVDILYHNGKSIGIEYVTGYDEAGNAALAKACNGSFKILNRSERDTRTVVDALCS
jgi:hypothetical protein